MKLIKMNEVQAEPVRWLWYPYIPYGKITLVQGDPGDGKTTFVLAVAALLTNGSSLPETEPAGTVAPQTVIYQTAEDGLADTIKPRLVEVGADCSRVVVIDEGERPLSFSDGRIEQAVNATRAGLLILDPLQAYLGACVDMHRANEIRPIFKTLGGVAERTGCAMLIIGHMNKAAGQTKGRYRGLGSIDIAAAVRSILLVGRDKDNQNTRVMAHLKSSLAPEGRPIAFELDEGGFRWVGAYEMTAEELLYGISPEREPTKEAQAVTLIHEMLRDGEVPGAEVYSRLAEYGISKRTAENAKGRIGVVSAKKGAAWIWKLPR
jgi:energy-coupling factor transporter ATP-binding protein EcfA2